MDSKNYKELEEIFKEVFSRYTSDVLIDKLFKDVYEKYIHRSRHYHNMNHISYMVDLWKTDMSRFKNADALFMAIIYHDIIYKPRKSDNEEKSVEYFEKIAQNYLEPFLKAGDYFKLLDDVKCAILATKHSDTSIVFWKDNMDIQYLLDFDLAVLGTSDKEIYEWYRKGVRKEYKIYPDFLYKPGRKKVLESFLSREKIYLTKDFEFLEKNARKNLKEEIKSYLC